MSKESFLYEDDINKFLERFLKVCLMLIFLGFISSFKLCRENPEKARKISKNYKFLATAASLVVLFGFLSSFVWGFFLVSMPLALLSSWGVQALLVFAGFPFWFQDNKTTRLSLGLLQNLKKPDFQNFKAHFKDKRNAPLGVSLTNQRPVLLPMKQRKEHVLISGATGMGKTTLMLSLMKHAFLHRYPLVIIDPKGDKTDIDFIQNLFQKCGRKKEDFKLFSLSQPIRVGLL